MDQFSLGNKGKLGNIDFSKIKAGIKKEELVGSDSQLASIFDSVDTNKKDGILDRQELDSLKQLLSDIAGDSELSNNEAKKFPNAEGNKVGRKGRDALFKFLNNLAQTADENVKSVETQNIDGKNVEVITYNDGRKEELYPDGTKITQITNGNKTVRVKQDDKDNVLEATTITDAGTDSEVTETSTFNGEKKVKTVTHNKNKGTETTVEYDENETPVKETVIENDAEGNPVRKTVTQGLTQEVYEYDDKGEPTKLVSKTENIGLATQRKITYTPNGETIEEGGKTIHRTRDENGYTDVTEENGVQIITKYGTNEKPISQTKVIDGQTYTAEYDENGFTKGIIVQNGESPAAIAKKFGCTTQELLDANKELVKGKGKGAYFPVGAEIKIPRRIDADKLMELNKNRKTSEEAQADFARDEAIRAQKRAAAAARDKQLRDAGLKNYEHRGETFTYGNKKYTVIGTMKNRARLMVKDERGNICIASHDHKILKDSYVRLTNLYDSKETQKVEINGRTYAVAGARGDKHGRLIGVDDKGRTVTISGGKSMTDLSDRSILRNDYLEASDAYDNGAAQVTLSGGENIKYVRDKNGKVWYFDAQTGKALVKEQHTQMVQAEADRASAIIYDAAHGLGTDEEKLAEGINMIYSPEIMSRVNITLASKDSDYAGDSETTPIEALLLDELSRTETRAHIRTLARNGAYGAGEALDQALGRNCAREVKYEVHGGILGYTGTADLKNALDLASTRGARLHTESLIKSEVKSGANEGSYMRAYIGEDGWNAQEVDQFDATWIKNNAYDHEHDQNHRNAVVGRLVFDYNDDNALHRGLEVIDDAPDGADMAYLSARAVEENQKHNYIAHFTNQDSVQIYLAGRTANNGEVDAEHVSACNTLLFKSEKPARIQAEEALYGAQKGNMAAVFSSMDPKVYAEIADLIALGNVKNCESLQDAYKLAMNGTNDINDKTTIKANAILSNQIPFSDKEITEFCIELMHNIDDNRGKGGSTGQSAAKINIADYQTEQLKAILQANPQIAAAVKKAVESGNFSYTTSTTTYAGPNSGPATTTEITRDSKDTYLSILNESRHVVEDAVFLAEDGTQITNPEQINALIEANMNALQNMREYVAQLEREFKMGIDAEGSFSDAANWLSTYSGIGTDRDDVATKYRNAKLLLNQLEAAAQGKLRDSSGNVISAQDLAENIIAKENELAGANSDYKTTISTAKMGMILAPVIIVTTAATAGTGAGFWTGAAVAGAATAGSEYGLNTIERVTSITGDTAEAREEHALSALIDGASTFIGVGQMKFIPKILNNAGTFVRSGGRLMTVAASDIGVGAAGEYVQTGTVTINGVAMNAVFSVTGNLIGIKSLAEKHIDPNVPKLEITDNLTGRDPIADGEIARNIDQRHLHADDRRIIEEGLADVPTPEEVAAYQRENGYQAPTAEERAALDIHQEQVAADYADAHELGNMVNAESLEALERARVNIEAGQTTPTSVTPASQQTIDQLTGEIRGIEGQIRDLNRRIAGAKRFGKDTSKLESQLSNLEAKRAAKAAELETLQRPMAEPEAVIQADEPEVIIFRPDEAEPSVHIEYAEPYKIPDSFKFAGEENGVKIYRTEAWNDIYQEIHVRDINGTPQKVLEKSVNGESVTSYTSYDYDPQGRLRQALTRDESNVILKNEIIDSDGVSIIYDCENGYVYADIQTPGKEQNSRIAYELPLDKLKMATAGENPGITAKNIAELANLPQGNIKYGTFQRVTTEEEADAVFRDFVQNKSKRITLDNSNERYRIVESEECNAEFEMRDGWAKHYHKDNTQGTDWKIHIYADSPTEWANVAQLSMPYLDSHKIDYKTISNFNDLTALATDTQRGKAFTVYFKNEEEFLQAAKDLEAIFSKSGMKSSGIVANDAQIGDSGFLSYRNERSSRYGAYKPADLEDPYLNMIARERAAAPEVTPQTAQHILTSEEKIQMSKLGNDITRANTLDDLAKAQQILDNMPECPQKTALKNQLDAKLKEIQQTVPTPDTAANAPETVEAIAESVDIDADVEIVSAIEATPHEALVFDLSNRLHCSGDFAEQLAVQIEARPEMAAQLSELALSSGRYPYEVKNLIDMANADNIDTLIQLSKNHNLTFEYDAITGKLIRNDFEIVMKIADSAPQFRAEILDVAANSQRSNTDIYQIKELMNAYPDNARDIALLTKSNPNIKVGYDINNNLSNQVDRILIYMDNNPQFEKEILDYMSVQRKALNDTSDPVAELQTHIQTLKHYPQYKDAATQLAKNPNLDAMAVRSFILDYGNNPSRLNDIIKLSGKKYTEGAINRAMANFERYPELRSIMLSDTPSYKLIDTNVGQTPYEIIQKRFEVRNRVEQVAGSELQTLQRTLGDEFYFKVKWEDIIPENASDAEIRSIISQLNDESKFFARTSVNERNYGKNIQWAHEINNISEAAALRIGNGENFEEVIHNIAADYRAYDVATTLDSNTKTNARREYSGRYRGKDQPQNHPYGASTPFTKNGGYSEYYDRFMAQLNKQRTSPYDDVLLTNLGDCDRGTCMLHPVNQTVEPAMKHIGQRYKELQPLFNKVHNGGKLTPAELKLADEKISEMYFLMGNVMPWARGSNGISDIFMRSTYKALGVEQPALRKGVSLDLEAFCMDLNEYKAKWNSFFEDGRTQH